MSDTLHFAAHTLQEVALIFMALVYTARLIWMFRFKAGKEKQMKTGLPDTSKRKGILYSLANIAMPWAMESTRNGLFVYAQFTIFHLGVVFAILQSFLIPYAPEVMANSALVAVFQIVIGAAFLVGLLRIVRRISGKVLRAISTPDDFFSLTLITVWFFFAFMATPNNYHETEFWLLAYFYLTAFFLIYVPFSKISHYLYYPFTRYFLGKTMGHRGGYPLRGTSQK
jgi:nitrate reductase gamma subunit